MNIESRWKSLQTPRSGCEDIIKTDIREIGSKYVNSVEAIQDWSHKVILYREFNKKNKVFDTVPIKNLTRPEYKIF
jgi:hypothetical protein